MVSAISWDPTAAESYVERIDDVYRRLEGRMYGQQASLW